MLNQNRHVREQLTLLIITNEIIFSVLIGGWENVPGIPGACAIRNFGYLVRSPSLCVIRYELHDVHFSSRLFILRLWARFNIKMSSYQYRKSHCGEKTSEDRLCADLRVQEQSIDEYDVTMPVSYIRVTSQINCGDVTILNQKRLSLATMAISAIDNCF